MDPQEFLTLVKESDTNDLSTKKLFEYVINIQLQKYFDEGKCNEFVELYNIKNIELKLKIDSIYWNIIPKINNVSVMKILIDNYENIVVQADLKLIHIICSWCKKPEIYKYMIDKGIDLECETSKMWRPIHYICNGSNSELIKYIIDKNVSIECKDIDKVMPIQYIHNECRAEIIKYIICKDLNYKPILALLHKNKL
jgi:ankyrin repeat protein